MKYFVLSLLVVLLPQFAQATVQISEVAWMGTQSSQYSEWLELYNDGDSATNLAGWKLYEGDGGALVFTLTKSIPANGYLLIERTTASAPDAVPAVNDESGPFGGGGFANTGEDLVLKNAEGSIVDELNYTDGWPAGDATTKQTMQWNGSTWITADPTPKAGVGESGTSSDDDIAQKASPEEKDPYPIPVVSPNKPRIEFTTPSVIYRGVSYQFDAQPVLEYNFHLETGTMYWNFGDGTTLQRNTVGQVSHTYQYSGMYTMYYSYSDPYTKNAPLTGTKKIHVLDPILTVSMVDTRAVELNNTSSTPVDLSGWKLFVDGALISIPDMTIVSEKSKATIPLIALGISRGTTARLLDPSGNMVAQTSKTYGVPVAASPDETIVSDAFIPEATDLVAQAVEHPEAKPTTLIRNRTKTFIFGAVALFVIGLSILLERAMARREYQ
jgi:hypothetical protein